jgi:hypothetical protein
MPEKCPCCGKRSHHMIEIAVCDEHPKVKGMQHKPGRGYSEIK